MSSNAEADGGSRPSVGSAYGAAGQLALAPKLRNGAHYATWRTDMQVWLERHGAQGIHTQAMSSEEWSECVEKVEHVKEAARLAALSLVLGRPLSSSLPSASASSSSTSKVKKEEKKSDENPDHKGEAMKIVKELVERSTRVYGVIYAALPEELRQQTESIQRGFAYGLWHWLELKYQSTEQDSVGLLLEQWVSLKQDEDESFDAYRARVDKLFALLKAADEQPSAGQYSLMLLDRLQPHFKQAVLALKASGQLKDVKQVNWETVTQFINSHEREIRRGANTDEVIARGAWANSAQMRQRTNVHGHDARDDRKKGANMLTCFFCDGVGHVKRDCPERTAWRLGRKPRGNEDAGEGGDRRVHGSSDDKGETAAAMRRTNRYASDDDDDESEEDRAFTMRISSGYVSDYERANSATGTSVERSFEQTKELATQVTNEKEVARLLPKAIDVNVSSYSSGRGSDDSSTVARAEKRGIKIDDGTIVQAGAAGTQGEYDSHGRVVGRIVKRRIVRGNGARVLVRWIGADEEGYTWEDSWELESEVRHLPAYEKFMASLPKVGSRYHRRY